MSDLLRHLQSVLADRFRVEREIGRGGMAIVFLAEEHKHRRAVALKVLRPEFIGVIARERFLREIHLSAEFNHPCILPLLDSGIAPEGDGQPALPYFSMPYVEGETLRQRLVRERQLPVEEAVAIARDVAAALDYAHGRGVVHRDIKPENIYLTGGHAVVADFGIARAVQQAVDPDALTSAGLVVGTPMYMSPEQAGGDVKLDGRSDIYALGCVLYEMLGGEPPFTGASAQAVLARHRLDPVPSLLTIRPSLPGPVERAVRRALAKAPADRFATGAEFSAALGSAASGAVVPAAPALVTVRWRFIAALGLVVALGLVAYAVVLDVGWRGDSPVAAPALDTTRYAVLDFAADTAVAAALQPALLLRDALARWEGITTVEPYRVQDLLARRGTAPPTAADWPRMAATLGAGRYVLASALRVGDSIRIHAALYSTSAPAGAEPLREATTRLPGDFAGAGPAFDGLADALLVASTAFGSASSTGGTLSLPARQAFGQGTSDLLAWDLERADSAFAAATRFDPEYARAHLWLALVRSWSDTKTPATWRSPAERASAGRERLSTQDRLISDAVLAQSRDELLKACRLWRELTARNEYDFVVWYGLATCLYQDRTVLRDPRSPSGWRFQSSYDAALDAYTHAYRLHPPILSGLRTESYAGMIQLLFAGSNAYRLGRGLPPNPPTFYAFPSWAGDSLVLYPRPWSGSGRPPNSADATTSEAVRHQRERLYGIARSWVAADPASADALQALAVSLQLLGDRSALDTLVRARRLATTADEAVRVATLEVWMRVLFSAPAGLSELHVARQLADSLLLNTPSDGSVEPMLLASLAALTGRADLAARLGRALNIRERPDTPPPLVGLGITFLTYASLGGPPDSLDPLGRRVLAALETSMAEDTRLRAREMWLELPILVGFPAYQFPQVRTIGDGEEGLLAADAAFLQGDTAGAWRAISTSRRSRPNPQNFEMTIDMGFGTAWLMAELGRPDTAAAYLDGFLDALPKAQPQFFLEVYQAGPLVRAMALRTDLADQLGNRETARAWAAAVVTLWSDADPFLQPVVRRMETLSR